MTRRQRTTNDLLHWRRSETVKLLAQGLTIHRVAEILQVSPATVKRDHAYIRAHSKEVLQNYFVDTLPNEVLKNIARLTAVSDSAWEIASKAKQEGDEKLRIEALRLAEDAANDINDIATNNEPLIDRAWEATDELERRKDELLHKESQEKKPRGQNQHIF